MRHALVTMLVTMLVAPLCAGCADELSPYGRIEGLRLLAVRASPPDVAPGEEAVLDALVTAEATYRWSWCPVRFGGPALDQCPISEADLRAVVADAGGGEVPPYDLGDEPTARFHHTLPPELLEAACEGAGEIRLPGAASPGRCDGRWEIEIRLVVAAGDASIAATRRLALIYDEGAVANRNPRIDGGEISVRGAPPFLLDPAAPTTVTREVEYRLLLDIDPSHAEEFERAGADGPETQKENLVVTWFVEAGEMEQERTGFIEGVSSFD